MANASITIDQFKDVLKRLEKLEHRGVEVPINTNKEINELKEKYYGIDKRTEVTDTKIDSLRTEMHAKINSLRTELRITFGITLTALIAIGIKIFTSSI